MGLEAKYKITGKCLEVLLEFGYKGKITIQTKSPLVTSDIDVLKKINATVGFTVTTLDDKVSRFIEVTAPPSTQRIKALSKLNENKISPMRLSDRYCLISPQEQIKLMRFWINCRRLEQMKCGLNTLILTDQLKRGFMNICKKNHLNSVLISKHQTLNNIATNWKKLSKNHYKAGV